ncbi:MAG: FHA domain-containing protein [Rhodoglobus sp.]
MSTASTIPVRSCGRCGGGFSERGRYCNHCGVVRIAPAESYARRTNDPALLIGTVSAPQLRCLAAVIIDIGIVLTVGTLVAVAGRATPTALLLACAAAIAGVCALFMGLRATGTSPGRRLCSIRTIDSLTALPPHGAAALRAVIASGPSTRWVDTRRGRDPFRSSAPRPRLGMLGSTRSAEQAHHQSSEELTFSDTREYARAEPAYALETAVARRVTIVFDSGQRVVIDKTMLIGRNPDTTAGPSLALPDLSRSLSKTHARLEWSGTELWVTDLTSTNGTTLISSAGRRTTLAPGARAAARVGWRIELGNRSFVITEAVDR